jgi:hypothetical protein
MTRTATMLPRYGQLRPLLVAGGVPLLLLAVVEKRLPLHSARRRLLLPKEQGEVEQRRPQVQAEADEARRQTAALAIALTMTTKTRIRTR